MAKHTPQATIVCRELLRAAAAVENLHHAGLPIDDIAWADLYQAILAAKAVHGEPAILLYLDRL